MAPRRCQKQLPPTDDGLQLPEGIIQHIQSFLLDKQAARTAVISKSWYSAWCTRPAVLLIGYKFDEISFWDYATKTIQRCIDLNVKVDKLELFMPYSYDAPVVDKLILDVLKLRVNDLKVSIYEETSDELYFVPAKVPFYVLPTQVFANKYLKELYLNHCKVDNLIPRNILCSDLRSLSLDNVSIDDSTFKDILVRIPIVESLTLSGELTTGLTRINAHDLCNLKTLVVDGLVLDSPGITTSVICGRFLNLSFMALNNMCIDDSFFTNFSSRFPNLENLTLGGLNRDANIQISSNSIKQLNTNGMWSTAKFDVPNIREFNYSGGLDFSGLVPPISLSASSWDLKSNIGLSKHDDVLDLSKLREFRKKFGWSKISFRLYVDHDSGVVPERSLEDSFLPAVEELTYIMMEYHPRYNFFIECVLSCRPKLVYFVQKFAALAIPILYEEFLKQKKNKLYTTTYGISLFWMNDLIEVSAEFLEDSLRQCPPYGSSPADLEIGNHKAEQLCLKLEWESLTSEQTIIKFINRVDYCQMFRY